MWNQLRQRLALYFTPSYEPTTEEKLAFYEQAKQEVRTEFYKELDVQSLFTEEDQGGLLKYVPVLNIVATIIVLVVVATK